MTHLGFPSTARSTGRERPPAAMWDRLAAELDRLDGRCDADEPTCLLTHHLVQDEACWRFIDRFVGAIRRHLSAAWIDLTDTPGTVHG